MTQRVKKKIRELQATTIRYSPRVTKQGPTAKGNKSKTAFSHSAAKYYLALKKLASE